MQELEKSLITSATLLGNFENGSAEWHEARNEPGAIGGSDIGAIMGWNAWESAITKWAKKTGKIDDYIEPSHRMRIGTKIETPLLEIFEEDHPELKVFWQLVKVFIFDDEGNEVLDPDGNPAYYLKKDYSVGTWASKAEPLNRANPDAIAMDRATGELIVLEVKFAGDNMTQIPISYDAQVTWYEGIFNIKRGILVACAGSNYVELPHEFDAFKFDTLCLKADEFRRYVANDIMPDFEGSNSTLQTMRAIHPDIEADAEVELGDLGIHLFNAYADLQEQEKKYRELQSRTLDALGQAKWGLIDDRRVVYRTARNGGTPYLAFKKGN